MHKSCCHQDPFGLCVLFGFSWSCTDNAEDSCFWDHGQRKGCSDFYLVTNLFPCHSLLHNNNTSLILYTLHAEYCGAKSCSETAEGIQNGSVQSRWLCILPWCITDWYQVLAHYIYLPSLVCITPPSFIWSRIAVTQATYSTVLTVGAISTVIHTAIASSSTQQWVFTSMSFWIVIILVPCRAIYILYVSGSYEAHKYNNQGSVTSTCKTCLCQIKLSRKCTHSTLPHHTLHYIGTWK